MIAFGDAKYVWGVLDTGKPLLNIPSWALGWKVRCRPRHWAYIYIRFDYGVEKRAIIGFDDHYEPADWASELNITGKALT